MYKTTTRWSGFQGAPGYTNFFFQGTGDGESAQACIDKTHAFWDVIDQLLGYNVSVQVQSDVEVLDPATGQMERIDAGVAPAALKSTNASSYPAAAGACITWLTGGVRNGRRVRGRTFIVPLNGQCYDQDGTLASAALTTLNTAAAALYSAGGAGLAIWGRPSGAGAADGVVHHVIGHRIQDKGAVLTSRRD